MENAKWIEERMAALAPPPAWQPEARVALDRHDRRVAARRLLWTAVAASLLVAALLVSPPGQALAQWVVKLVRLGRVEFVLMRTQAPHSLVSRLRIGDLPVPARSAAEAAGRVRFLPRLPHAGVLTGTPALSTMAPVSSELRLDVFRLRADLAAAGASEVAVPESWNGVTLRVVYGPVVVADYPQLQLIQSPPIAMTAPPEFDSEAFFRAHSASCISSPPRRSASQSVCPCPRRCFSPLTAIIPSGFAR